MSVLKHWVGTTTVLLLALSGCGGGGGSGDSSTTTGTPVPSGIPGSNPELTRTITETNIEIPPTTQVVVVQDFGASQSELSNATYQIQMFWSSPNGMSFNEILGTGFAVGGDLIATNAHVSGEILNRARNYQQFGFSLSRASAFRAETGEEIPLLEALVHPSWNGDPRSPDIGLFVARSGLPVALELATNSEISNLRAGNQINLNGFPGDVFDAVFSRGFMPGLSIPQATLFSGNIQSLQKFDERSVIDQNNPLSIDMIQHSMDTSGGTSGSPILANGKVVGVHNSGLGQTAFVVGPDGTPRPQRITQATASWGIHVKHLRNLLAEFDTGVMEADKRYRIPPEPALLGPTQVQAANPTPSAGAAGSFNAVVTDAGNFGIDHNISMTIDANFNVTGTSSWPENPALGLGDRQFTLTGSVDQFGRLEVTDNTPEIIPGFRRGLYIGFINPASGGILGEYYEIDDNNQLLFFGDFQATVQ